MADKLKVRELTSTCVVDAAGRNANYDKVRALGLPLVAQLPERKEPLAVVASGPSVAKHLEELRRWTGDLWAINGAYDYLLEQDIVADGFFAIDPLPQLVEYVQHPREQTTFYLGSACDLSVFEALKGCNVQTFHAAADDMKYPKDEWVVGGGTTAVTRVPYFGLLQGFRDITIYGCDSSFNGTEYCYPWGRYSTDIASSKMSVVINNEGPFETEIGLMKQVSQMGVLMTRLNGKLKVKCDGLMDAFLRSPIMSDEGIELDKTDDESQDSEAAVGDHDNELDRQSEVQSDQRALADGN